MVAAASAARLLVGSSSRGSNASDTTRLNLHGKFSFAQTDGRIIDQITPVLLGSPLSTIAEEFLFFRFHRLRFRIIRWNLDATLAETTKMFALGVYQASNAIGNPTITTAENSIGNVQYGRASHIAPEVNSNFSTWYEWLEPKLAIGPFGGWFRTVGGSDDEDGDSAGILYLVSDVTTGNTSSVEIEFEVDVEFKEIVENTITPTAGSISLRYPGFRAFPGCSSPRFIDFRDPSQHPVLSKVTWPLVRLSPAQKYKNNKNLQGDLDDSVVVLSQTSLKRRVAPP
jgi:hypothetical protein